LILSFVNMCYFQYSHTVFAYLGFQLKWFQLLKDQYGSKLQSCGCHWKKHMVKPMVKPNNFVKSHDGHVQMPCYLPKVLIFPTKKSPKKGETLRAAGATQPGPWKLQHLLWGDDGNWWNESQVLKIPEEYSCLMLLDIWYTCLLVAYII
jgi:hypothetical protein